MAVITRTQCSACFCPDMLQADVGRVDVSMPSLVLCPRNPHPVPWESWSSRLFEFDQPNSPATPSGDEHATYFTDASRLPPEAYACPQAFAAEAFIDVESGYCSEDDADKQDLQYRLLVGGMRSCSGSSRKHFRSNVAHRTIKALRKPCKTRYAFQTSDYTRKLPEPQLASQASVGTYVKNRVQACCCATKSSLIDTYRSLTYTVVLSRELVAHNG